jgi:hypothetical protein
VFNPRFSAAESVRLTVFRATHSCEVSAILFRGLLSPIQTDETRQAHPGPPYPRAPRLGPRAFSVGSVDSFGDNFVGHHLYSRTNFKLNRAAALAEWRQLLSA